MKKYGLLILAIAILVLTFLNNWFIDYLLDSLFIFAIIPSMLLLILYIVCIIFNVKKLSKQKTAINIITFCILILTCAITLFFPFREARVKLELKLYESKRAEVISLVKNNELKVDDNGNAKLPKKLNMVSISGEVRVYQNDDSGTQIGFWIFRGVQSGSIQLMYSSNGEQLIRDNETGHPIVSIEKLKDNWYYVVTDY